MTNAEKAVVFLRKLEECGLTLNDLADIIEELAPKNPDDRSSTELTKSEKSYDKFLKKEITKLMHEIGIPAHLSGYAYIRRSIELIYKKPNLINAVTNELYPMLANEFDTTPCRVKRNIQNAISVTWKRGNEEVLEKYFGYIINPSKGKPTNSEFIATLADNFCLKYKL